MLKNIPETTRLVVKFPDDILYCIPEEILPNSSRYNGFKNRSSKENSCELTTLKDLLTDEIFLLPDSCLYSFSVPDERVGHYIRQFRVRGISTPYKWQPTEIDPLEVPLYGNVTNPTWAVINLGGSCNSHCTFCYTEWLRFVPDLHTNQVKDVIDRIAQISSIKVLLFSGGEATLRRDLVSLFAYAKHTGFPDIALHTNGRELRDIQFVEKLVELGLKRVLLSLHGPNEKIHDTITGSPGSFLEALKGLRNLKTLSIEPTVNIVMCKENYEYLIEIVSLLSKIFSEYGRLRFSYPIVEGAAFENVEQVLVPFSQLKPHMLAAMQFAEEKGFEVQTANMPLCIPDDSHRDTTYDTEVLSEFVEASPFYKFNIPRGEKSVKLNSCTQCSKVNLCRGIQVEYLRVYPDSIEEFKPIKDK
jgi:sulfatase maturation enzyme AslB (radical SAM superfamily)